MSNTPVRQFRLRYSHGKGFAVEVQDDTRAPWTARTPFLGTIEEAIAAAGAVGREFAFPLTAV